MKKEDKKVDMAFFKNLLLNASDEGAMKFKQMQFVKDWLEGEIGDEEYNEANHTLLKGKGYVKASGSWWPKSLVEEGAIEIREGEIFVRGTEEDIWGEDKRTGEYKQIKKAFIPHPAFTKYLREERRDIIAREYADHVVEEAWKEEKEQLKPPEDELRLFDNGGIDDEPRRKEWWDV